MGRAAARMMMVLLGRAFVTVAMWIYRHGCVVMIVLAARLGKVGAAGKTTRIGPKDAGIQPDQRANNHQPHENQSHQSDGDSMQFIANSRKNSLAEAGRPGIWSKTRESSSLLISSWCQT